MAHFADLSLCDYFPRISSGRLLAIGWLEAGFPFAVGDPGEAVYSKVSELLDEPWQPGIFMGGHPCQLCRFDGFFSVKNLFVPGSGVTYVAPEGIRHYISAHGYCPPEEFREAVLACPPMGSTAYFAALQTCGWEDILREPQEEELAWLLKWRRVNVLKSIGNLLVAQIEEYQAIHGRIPEQLPTIRDALQHGGTWNYEVVKASGRGPLRHTFQLTRAPSPNDDIVLEFAPTHRQWWWIEGNTSTSL